MRKLVACVTVLLVAMGFSLSYAELPKKTIESFSDYRLNCENQWGNRYFMDGEAYTDSGDLHIIYNPHHKSSNANNHCGFEATPNQTSMHELRTTMKVVAFPEFSISPHARVLGNFYGNITDPANPNEVSQVYANIRIGVTQSGLVATWSIFIDGNEFSFGYDTGEFSSAINIGSTYPVSIEYDESSSQFHFGFNGQMVTRNAPSNDAPANYNRIRLQAKATYDDQAYTPTTYAPVHAVFGDVYINNQATPYDDFSNTLSLAKWQEPERARLNQNGAHKFSVKSANADLHRVRFKIPEEC